MSKDANIERFAAKVAFIRSTDNMPNRYLEVDGKIVNDHTIVGFSSIGELEKHVKSMFSPFDCALCIECKHVGFIDGFEKKVDDVNDIINTAKRLAKKIETTGKTASVDLEEERAKIKKELETKADKDLAKRRKELEKELEEKYAGQSNTTSDAPLTEKDIETLKTLCESLDGRHSVYKEAVEMCESNGIKTDDMSSFDIICNAGFENRVLNSNN